MMHSRNVGDVIDKETGVDFNHFIEITIQKKMPWKSLAFILFHFAPTLEKSQKVIEILVQELELWVTKVENNQIKVPEIDNGHYIDSLEDSEKANSEDESIVSDSEISNDVDIIENEVVESKQSFEKEQKEAFEDHVNISDDKSDTFVKEGKEDLVNEFDSEGTPKILKDAESKLDLVASMYYEFIGGDDTDSKDIGEFSSVEDQAETEKDLSKLNRVMEEEDDFKVECDNPNENEGTTINIRERKKHQCNFCDKSFAKNSWKDRHERIHTGEKPFQCESCLRAFKEKGALDRHKMTHSGEKPYQCMTCKKAFRALNNLKQHEKIHEGLLLPYSCEICEKSFSKKQNLKVHYRTHNDERPFECKTCPYRFRQMAHLQRHQNTH